MAVLQVDSASRIDAPSVAIALLAVASAAVASTSLHTLSIVAACLLWLLTVPVSTILVMHRLRANSLAEGVAAAVLAELVAGTLAGALLYVAHVPITRGSVSVVLAIFSLALLAVRYAVRPRSSVDEFLTDEVDAPQPEATKWRLAPWALGGVLVAVAVTLSFLSENSFQNSETFSSLGVVRTATAGELRVTVENHNEDSLSYMISVTESTGQTVTQDIQVKKNHSVVKIFTSLAAGNTTVVLEANGTAIVRSSIIVN